MSNENKKDEPDNSFIKNSEGKQLGLVAEFIGFLATNKKYWMIPILVVLLILGALILLGGTSVAPFIYPFF